MGTTRRSHKKLSGSAAAGCALSMLVAAILFSVRVTGADDPDLFPLIFSNASGIHRTLSTAGPIDTGNPFFQDLGTNGRTCFTCHRPEQAWTVTPPELRERFRLTRGLDPIFRTNDGSNCEGADVSSIGARRAAFSLLLSKGLIRVELDVPGQRRVHDRRRGRSVRMRRAVHGGVDVPAAAALDEPAVSEHGHVGRP